MKHLHRTALCTLGLLVISAFVFTAPAHAAANVAAGATLSIPALHIQGSVIEAPQTMISGFLTWDLTTLGNHIAHLGGTSWTGDGPDKNIVLAGHNTLSNGRPAIFWTLNRIKIGDSVILTQNGTTFTYVVTQTALVDPTSFDVIYPSGKDQLTLLTCAGAFDTHTGTYAQRLVVTAIRIS